MARPKRTHPDENDYTPPPMKRRAAVPSTRATNKSFIPPTPVLIDLSSEPSPTTSTTQRQPSPKRAMLKYLPPNSAHDDFPRFSKGEVYIIVDPQNLKYQYRLHAAVLAQMSPKFAESLKRSYPEVAEGLKVRQTHAEARFELFKSEKHGKWIFRRTPFTVWEHADAGMRGPVTESGSEVSSSPRKASDVSDSPSNVSDVSDSPSNVSDVSDSSSNVSGDNTLQDLNPPMQLETVIDVSGSTNKASSETFLHDYNLSVQPETASHVSDLPSNSSSESVLQNLHPHIHPETDTGGDNRATISCLGSDTVEDQVTVVTGANAEENSLQENANDVPVASQKAEFSVEENIEPVSTESGGQLSGGGESHSSQSGSNGTVTLPEPQVILDASDRAFVAQAKELDESVMIENIHSSILNATSEQPDSSSSTLEEIEAAKGDEEPIGLKSPPDGGESSYETQIDGQAPVSTALIESTLEILKSSSEAEEASLEIQTEQQASISTVLHESTLEISSFDDPSEVETTEENFTPIMARSGPKAPQASMKIDTPHLLGQQASNCHSKSITATGPPIELCEAYNNLFRIVYGKDPAISTTSINTALQQCEALISISTYLDTIHLVRPHAAKALSRFGKQIYTAIAVDPFRWLKLSLAFEATTIFRECIIHIVGSYIPSPQGQYNLPADIPLSIRDLIIFKVRQVDQQRMDINERLCLSSIVLDARRVQSSTIDTTTPSSTWLVVQIWRDWFCRQLADAVLDPMKTGSIYRTIYKGGDAYLPLSEVRAAAAKILDPVKIEPDVIREDLDLMKNFAQETVKGLCKNQSILDRDEIAGVRYLTCTRVEDEELPWYNNSELHLQ